MYTCGFRQKYIDTWASRVAQTVKNPPEMQETQVRSPGWEDTLEKGMANHSIILAWIILWTEKPGGLQSMESQTVRHNWMIETFAFIMTSIHHYNVMWSIFTVLKSPLCFTYSSSTTPINHWSFDSLHSYIFSRLSYSWNHTVWSLFRLASLVE